MNRGQRINCLFICSRHTEIVGGSSGCRHIILVHMTCVILWQVNQKMLLTLTASIMFWSLQQPVDSSEASPSPADVSPATSISSEDEGSTSLGGEISNLSIDETASEVSSQLDNEVNSFGDGSRGEETGCIAVK